MLPRRTLLALPALTLPALLPGLSRAQPRPVLVASFSILDDMTRQIAGADAPIRVLAGPETDPHHFQPRPSDAEAIRGAGLIIRNGLGFEPWLDRLLGATRQARPVVTATEGIVPLPATAGHGHDHGAADPHAWQDVGLAQSYARAIANGLAAAEPGRAAAIRAAEAAWIARLAALDAWVRDRIASVPAERRVMVTSHEAFGYFARAYGVRVLAAQGVAAEGQAAASKVAALIRQIRAERITAVFIEGQRSQAVLERLAADAGVVPRGRLYADTLSPPDGPAPGYEAMVRHNLGLIVPAMLG